MGNADELQKYAELDGTELGELCVILCQASRYPSYMSDAFERALDREIRASLKDYQENSQIVEEEEQVTCKQPVLRWTTRGSRS